jgi:hypothetical protein
VGTPDKPKFMKECVSTTAHLMLARFDEGLACLLARTKGKKSKSEQEKWAKDVRHFVGFLNQRDRIDTTSMGITSHLTSIDCKRFLLRSLGSLKKLPHKWYQPYFPWQVYGSVTGDLLVWEIGSIDKVDSRRLFAYWEDKFDRSRWTVRVSILEGFKRTALKCTQWDKPFWDAVEYFLVYCEGTMSIPTEGDKPEGFYKAVEGMMDIWLCIAQTFDTERRSFDYNKKLIEESPNKDTLKPDEDTLKYVGDVLRSVRKKIVKTAPRLLRLIHDIRNYRGFNVKSFGDWNGMLFTHTLPSMEKEESDEIRNEAILIKEELLKISSEQISGEEKSYVDEALTGISIYTQGTNNGEGVSEQS